MSDLFVPAHRPRSARCSTRSAWTARAGVAALAVMTTLMVLAAPGGTQYGGGGIQAFLERVRVPVDQHFGVFGRDCATGSTVEITIDGVPGVLGTSTATANGFYSVSPIDLPNGSAAGTQQGVRATCGPETATVLMTLVCPGGDDPVDGTCEDGSDGVAGGAGPTTTAPATSSTTVATSDQGSDGSSGGGGSSGGNANTAGTDPGAGIGSQGLAFTGAAFTQMFTQLGVTLFALGFVLIMVARRRKLEAV